MDNVAIHVPSSHSCMSRYRVLHSSGDTESVSALLYHAIMQDGLDGGPDRANPAIILIP